jgi:hypothetical protein
LKKIQFDIEEFKQPDLPAELVIDGDFGIQIRVSVLGIVDPCGRRCGKSPGYLRPDQGVGTRKAIDDTAGGTDFGPEIFVVVRFPRVKVSLP